MVKLIELAPYPACRLHGKGQAVLRCVQDFVLIKYSKMTGTETTALKEEFST